MLETTLTQTVMAMIAVQQQAPGTEVAGLAFAIATLCGEFLDNMTDEAEEADDAEEAN